MSYGVECDGAALGVVFAYVYFVVATGALVAGANEIIEEVCHGYFLSCVKMQCSTLECSAEWELLMCGGIATDKDTMRLLEVLCEGDACEEITAAVLEGVFGELVDGAIGDAAEVCGELPCFGAVLGEPEYGAGCRLEELPYEYALRGGIACAGEGECALIRKGIDHARKKRGVESVLEGYG